MKYFYHKSELYGTDCHEFFCGKWDGKFWNESSVYIYDDEFQITGLKRVLAHNLKDYSPYEATEVFPEDWEKICQAAKLTAGDAVREISDWVKKAFDEHGMFTILGI